MSIIGTIHEDVTTDVLGQIGSWQWLVTFISTTLMTSTLFNLYEDIFLMEPSGVLCIPPINIEIINKSLCFMTLESNDSTPFKCDKWNVHLMWLIWIKKTWLVFCDHKLKLLTTALISRFGLVFGFITYGLISDSFGRKTAVKINVFCDLGMGLLITFCDSQGWFRLLVFLKSLFCSANYYMGLLIVCEIASNRWRSWLNVIVVFPRLVANVCMVPLANSALNPETYNCISSILCVTYIILLRWIPESPQWLLFNRKVAIAEKILLNAAKRNGIKLCDDFRIRPMNHRAYNCIDESATCVGVLNTYNTRTIVLVISLFWLLFYFLWSSLYVRVYSGEDINQLLIKTFCFVGMLGCLTVILSAKMTLRYLLLAHVLVTGVLTTGVIFMCKGFLRNILSSIAIASGIICQALLLNITPRLLAINIRTTILGCCHAAGQLGSMISYLLFMFHPMAQITFIAVHIVVALTLAGLCFGILDVDAREVPDVLEDMDYFSELSKPLRWATQKTSSPSQEEVEIRVYSFGSAGRSLSTHSLPDRQPAKPIGYLKLWRRIIQFIRRSH